MIQINVQFLPFRHPGLDPGSLWCALHRIMGRFRYYRKRGKEHQARNDVAEAFVSFFLKLALMGLDPQSRSLALLLQKEIPRQARNDEYLFIQNA